MLSERFLNRAVGISVGSLSPTTNWTTLNLEFDIPPLDQQRRIAEILWAVDEVRDHWTQRRSNRCTWRRIARLTRSLSMG